MEMYIVCSESNIHSYTSWIPSGIYLKILRPYLVTCASFIYCAYYLLWSILEISEDNFVKFLILINFDDLNSFSSYDIFIFPETLKYHKKHYQGAFCVKFTNAIEGSWELLSEKFSSQLRNILEVFYSHRIADQDDSLHESSS